MIVAPIFIFFLLIMKMRFVFQILVPTEALEFCSKLDKNTYNRMTPNRSHVAFQFDFIIKAHSIMDWNIWLAFWALIWNYSWTWRNCNAKLPLRGFLYNFAKWSTELSLFHSFKKIANYQANDVHKFCTSSFLNCKH